MQPASTSTPPRMLMPALVTRPAAASVHPKASTKGHAVGAGKVNGRARCVFLSVLSNFRMGSITVYLPTM